MSTFSQITASFKFQLLQIPASSGNYYFKLRRILASSNSGSHRRPFYFRLRKILASSISEKFQLLQIPASKNSSFSKFWLPQATYSKTGCEKFWLRRILSLITVSSLQTPLTFLVESCLENLDHLGFFFVDRCLALLP